MNVAQGIESHHQLKIQGANVKRIQFLNTRIAAALKQHELGMPISDIIRQAGINKRTFLRWKKAYAGLIETRLTDPNPENENVNLKRLVVELILENSQLKNERENKQVR